MKTNPINPQRLRRIPHQFSWIDHRLVRQDHLQRCDHATMSLYLFYLTVADAKGMSYYADARLMLNLSMTQNQLNGARQCLITQDLMAYAPPFVQVLSLDKPPASIPASVTRQASHQTKPGHVSGDQRPSVQTSIDQEKNKALIQKLQAQLRKPQ